MDKEKINPIIIDAVLCLLDKDADDDMIKVVSETYDQTDNGAFFDKVKE